MNRLLLLILIVILLSAAYFAFRPKQTHEMPVQTELTTQGKKEGDWRAYTPPSGKFAVILPVLPQRATDTVNDESTQEPRRYEMYIAQSADGTSYLINLITYPDSSELADRQAIFKSFVDDMIASNVHNQLVSSTPAQFQGHEAMDFNIQNNEGTLTSKMFIDGNTLYVLSRLARPDTPENGDFEKFISSFSIKRSEASIRNESKLKSPPLPSKTN